MNLKTASSVPLRPSWALPPSAEDSAGRDVVGTFSQDVPEQKSRLSMKSSFGCIFIKEKTTK